MIPGVTIWRAFSGTFFGSAKRRMAVSWSAIMVDSNFLESIKTLKIWI
jgi:hypothetical protein